MKRLKLSKTSWLILSAGVFIVVLAGLGVTRSQQLKEQNKLGEELSVSEMRLSKLEIAQLQRQLYELQERVDEGEVQLTEDKDRLRQSADSVDVTEKFFTIAKYCGVTVMTLGTSIISTDAIDGIEFSMISLNARVEGESQNLIDFIISINNGYTTGYVRSAQIAIPETANETGSSAIIQMVTHSYEGN